MNSEEKIIVGVSGGVDSSVTALLLKQQGKNVEALFMKNWEETDQHGACLWETDVEDAMHVCETLDIPINTVDLSRDYWDNVFHNFLQEYQNGRTPNPDILCNQEIKFKAFLDHAKEQGATTIATGHYARIEQQNEKYKLLKGLDPGKDQSYFLCRLNQSQLSQSLFPVGQLEKTEVRQMAEKAGLITHNKKDSTGICFIGEQPFRQFLQRFIPPNPGLIKTTAGKTIAEHDGVFYYTLGQRQGLGIGGVSGYDESPWYVVQKNIQENELVVAQDHSHPLLQAQALSASSINWIAGSAPSLPYRCQAKIRYRQKDQACVIESCEKDNYLIRFDMPQRAITPGQFIVFYEDFVCLGGGIIDKTMTVND